eukprot:Tamp_27367.p5 GENE.Tamp_27367~~Tamp_27367.p5  ORF type:complete len:106 (-),score=3.39 Tamp_27367:394-711(-)
MSACTDMRTCVFRNMSVWVHVCACPSPSALRHPPPPPLHHASPLPAEAADSAASHVPEWAPRKEGAKAAASTRARPQAKLCAFPLDCLSCVPASPTPTPADRTHS